MLGLSSDARVHISAPGIDVVITGDPEHVRSLLLVVKHELERNTRWRDRAMGPGDRRVQKRGRSDKHPSVDQKRPQLTPTRAAQYVQPSELDEMDSPYALPDPLVMPVEETTDETQAARESDPELATLVPELESQGTPPEDATPLPAPRAKSLPALGPRESSEEGEREITDVKANPSGPSPLPPAPPPQVIRTPSPFVTDAGPTLTPDSRDMRTLDQEVEDKKGTPPPGR